MSAAGTTGSGVEMFPPRTRLCASRTLASVALAVAALAVTLAGCGSSPPVKYERQTMQLNDGLVAQVHAGMTKEQVRALIGDPARIGTDRASGLEEWLWRYERDAIYGMCFYARFAPDGRVAGTDTMIESELGDPGDYRRC